MDTQHVTVHVEDDEVASLESVAAMAAAPRWIALSIVGGTPWTRFQRLAVLLNRIPQDRASRAKPVTEAGGLYIVL